MLLEKDPEDDTSLASFGWLNYVGATSHEPVLMARSINPDINTDMGFALIEKAIKINPQNSWAQQTLSSLKLYVQNWLFSKTLPILIILPGLVSVLLIMVIGTALCV